MKKKYFVWIVLIIIVLSFVIRLYPSFVTPYPYNVDGLTEARAAEYIATNGNMNYPLDVHYNNLHSPVTPLYNAFLGALSQLSGMEPMYMAQILTAIISSIAVGGWILLGYKFTENRIIALLIGSFFALSGTYVLHSVFTWKPSFGFVFIPFIIYYYNDKKMHYISFLLLFALMFIHHYIAIITYLIITYIFIMEFYQIVKKHDLITKDIIRNAIEICAIWIVLAIYYNIKSFDRVEYLSTEGELWLFSSIIVLLTLLTFKGLEMSSKKPKIWKISLVSLIGLGIYGINFLTPLFPDTIKLDRHMLFLTVGYVLLVPLMAIGFSLLSQTKYENKHIFIAILFAPLTMIVFAFVRGFDFFSYHIIGRTFDFLDFTFAISIAVALVYIIKTYKFGWKRQVAFIIALFILLASTTPLAYNTKENIGGDNFVYEYEVKALGFVDENYRYYNGSISTDDKYTQIGQRIYDLNISMSLPLKIRYNIEINNKMLIMADYWEDGAQMCPSAPIKISHTEMNNIMNSGNVVYISGSLNQKLYVIENL